VGLECRNAHRDPGFKIHVRAPDVALSSKETYEMKDWFQKKWPCLMKNTWQQHRMIYPLWGKKISSSGSLDLAAILRAAKRVVQLQLYNPPFHPSVPTGAPTVVRRRFTEVAPDIHHPHWQKVLCSFAS
jgi:hypothetical protein